MDSANSKASIAVSAPSQSSSKRLLFDRRYGWVFDEWKDPSEEALAGGRGILEREFHRSPLFRDTINMVKKISNTTRRFCILPIAKAVLKTASDSINLAASSAVEVYERPELLSPQSLKASVNGWLRNISSFVQKPEFNCLTVKGNSTSDSIIYTSHLHIGNRE
ncbi:hypothetical protein Patl1_07726 [Pistacia atlantica]|uniref:Uncharacterized protein n=1 Tax=Pistacia atlantica TaxID=434234 RepID=A0ACC1AHJ4_9ROSI|nr:hypothetical protein Patl1_07726 [Pistacia atlantica]